MFVQLLHPIVIFIVLRHLLVIVIIRVRVLFFRCFVVFIIHFFLGLISLRYSFEIIISVIVNVGFLKLIKFTRMLIWLVVIKLVVVISGSDVVHELAVLSIPLLDVVVTVTNIGLVHLLILVH